MGIADNMAIQGATADQIKEALTKLNLQLILQIHDDLTIERKEELMAKSTVKFNCGCGFSTTNPLEAVIHSDTKGHTLDALGTIRPDSRYEPKEEKWNDES